MSAKEIYIRLREYGLTVESACAMLGNMQAESGLKSNIAQLGMTSLSDEAYTTRADNGALDFVNDGVGYGLCQWTYHTRKFMLREFARARGVSVGNEAMQVYFACEELKSDYASLWGYLCGSHDLKTATERICKEYERPAVNNLKTRTEYAKHWCSKAMAEDWESAVRSGADDTYGDTPTTPFWPPRVLCEGMVGADVAVLQALLLAHDYGGKITGTFDNQTKCMVLAFQGEHGLDTDGIAGAKTFGALGVRA